MTVSDLYNQYTEYHSHETRKTSHVSADKNLRLHVLPALAGYRLDRLSQPVLVSWKNDISATDYCISTKRSIYAAFVAMLNYAVKMGYIVKNPLTVLGNFKAPEISERSAEKLHFYTSTHRNSFKNLSLLTVIPLSPALTGGIMYFSAQHFIPAHEREEERAVSILNKISP